MDERFAVLRRMLTTVWEREQLVELTRACAQALALAEQTNEGAAAYSHSTAQLKAYLRTRSKLVLQHLDKLVQEAPCTTYSRIKYMELLNGSPVAWGTPVDLNVRAQDVLERLVRLVRTPVEQIRAILKNATLVQRDEAQAAVEELTKWDADMETALSTPLLTELLRIFQHMDDSRDQWEKAPIRSLNFQDHLGADRFDKLQAALDKVGIAPKPGKGKMDMVAAIHAACDQFGLKVPAPGQWPEMLQATFPGTTWSMKCKPEERKGYQTASYRVAFQAIQDRLR